MRAVGPDDPLSRSGPFPVPGVMQTIDAWTQPLSAREREVLSLLAHGHTYASIAVALEISVRTVQGHVKGIYRKLQVASKAEAAVFAARSGLLS